MKERLRIGVIGAGAIAQLAHLPVLAKMRGAEIAAICDNDRPKARALADRFAPTPRPRFTHPRQKLTHEMWQSPSLGEGNGSNLNCHTRLLASCAWKQH